MKKLISAEFVRQEHAAGRNRIDAALPATIVTPEARGVAAQLGVDIVETLQGLPATGFKQDKEPADSRDVENIRKAILEKLPPGCVSEAVVDQLIRKTIEERQAGTAVEARGTAVYATQRIARGIKHVSADSVSFGRFEGAGADSQVGLTDVLTSEDGSPMAAGYMAWSKCFFPWTLNYDEVDVVLEGELHIRSEGQTVVGRVGDVIFIPKGSVIEFGTPSHTRFLYVTYPADWQGTQS